MKTLLPLTLLAVSLPAMAAQPDLLPVKQISLELARDIAMASVEACRQDGQRLCRGAKGGGTARIRHVGPTNRGFRARVTSQPPRG